MVYLKVERVTVRRERDGHVWGISPSSIQVLPDTRLSGSAGKLVILTSERNRSVDDGQSLINNQHAKRPVTQLLTYDRPNPDPSEEIKSWHEGSFEVRHIDNAPSWFGARRVIQFWFDTDDRDRVYVRAGDYIVGSPNFGINRNPVDQISIGKLGEPYIPMPNDWTRLSEGQYIVVTKAKSTIEKFLSFDCTNHESYGMNDKNITDEQLQELIDHDGFIRMKFQCGRLNQR
jgi:hypothetical protein